MDYIYVGKIMTTHGLKGELKIRSNFKYKDLIFKINRYLYIGNNYEKHIILSYRKHQDYDMVILSNIDDINKAINYKMLDVYVLKEELNLQTNNYLTEDLVGLNIIYHNKKIGKVVDVVDFNNNELLKLKDFYIPNNSHFIKNIDLNKKVIIVDNIEGLML